MATKSKLTFLTTLLFMITASSSWATTVNFTLSGHVTNFYGGTDFGLNVNDPVTATGSFDDSLIGGDIVNGSGTLDFTTDITDLLISVGSQVFTSGDDNGSGSLAIDNGTVLDGLGSAGFDYAGTNSGGNLLTSFTGTDSFLGNSELYGIWDTFELTAVPAPAAVWLFGSGVLALVGVARRKSA